MPLECLRDTAASPPPDLLADAALMSISLDSVRAEDLGLPGVALVFFGGEPFRVAGSGDGLRWPASVPLAPVDLARALDIMDTSFFFRSYSSVSFSFSLVNLVFLVLRSFTCAYSVSMRSSSSRLRGACLLVPPGHVAPQITTSSATEDESLTCTLIV